VTAIPFRLLPDTAKADNEGRLSIGGIDVAELAEKHGTPLFIYDEGHLRTRCREAVEAFGRDRVVYATKAFLCGAMARLAVEEHLMLDVATGGELFTALHAGVDPSRCVLHGNNKSDDEIEYALRVGVNHIVVDSFDEMDRIERIVSDPKSENVGKTVAILLRVTPGVHVHTHEFVQTGQDDSKFGFNLKNGDAHRALDRAFASSALNLLGLHCHIGSNVLEVDNFAIAAQVMVDFFSTVQDSHQLTHLTLGGGLGVAYVESEHEPSITQWAEVIKGATASLPTRTIISVEPGRAIVASAAVTVYRVGTVKHIEGIRTYIAVDGGMSDNPRPMMYESEYEVFDPTRVTAERSDRGRVVGKHCESGDIIVSDAVVPQGVAVGDLLATAVTGAYGYSMASNYNKVPRPAVVFVSDGKAHVVIRRETYDDLVRLDSHHG
jgi:diaminopimelate decarboxylase